MSGIGEALTVIAVVASLVSAFKDGGAIAEQIKKRRKQRNKLPPTEDLKISLETSQREFEEEQRRGQERLKEQFNHDCTWTIIPALGE